MSWSIERALVGLTATVAVAVDTLLDLIPAQAIRCALDRDYSCTVTRAAAEYDAAEQLAEREEEIEAWEPGCTCPRWGNPNWPHRHGCPAHTWEPLAREKNPTEPALSDDELVALRGLIQERYQDSSPVLGHGPGDGPSEVCGDSPGSPPSEGHPTDFSRGVEAAANIVAQAAQRQWRTHLDSPQVNPVVGLMDVARLLDSLTQELRDHAKEYTPK